MIEKKRLKAVRFPEALVKDLNKHIKQGKQSEFIIKATEDSLLRFKQTKALKECQGVFKAEDYPEFENRENIEKWLRDLRQQSRQ